MVVFWHYWVTEPGDEELLLTSTEPPYSPTFGADPPWSAGRDATLATMLGGRRAGPKSRYFGMGIIGERGVGKTVLLNEIERQAKSSLGWQYI
jgi:hypothetical protein